MNNYGFPQPNGNVFDWVTGENEVYNYRLTPNTVGVFIENNRPIMYLKSADSLGRPSAVEKRFLVTEEEYQKLQNQEQISYVTKEDLETALAALDSRYVIRKGKNDGK